MSGEILITVALNGAGKSTIATPYFESHRRLNRDELGGTLAGINAILQKYIAKGERQFILDNTYTTKELRAPIIEIGKKAGIPVKCLWLQTSIEDAQVNCTSRMMHFCQRILGPEEIKTSKNPHIFPPAVLFSSKSKFEPPSPAEGFSEIVKIPFIRARGPQYVNKAVILDYDGTLRKTKSGDKFPVDPDDIEILPNRREILLDWQEKGYRLLGVSNQSGVSKGDLSREDAIACFEKTNELLGIDIEYVFCPHRAAPISCWCRKPMPGHGVYFIEKYELDAASVIMVGDMTTDKTFATRSGFQFQYAHKFFAK